MSGTIIGIANAFGSSLTPGTVGQGQGPAPTPGADPMTFSVLPYNSGGTSTPSGQYKLGLYSTGTYNFTVNWGDGSSDDVITSYNQPEATHDYGVVTPADIFLITITANTAFASSSFDHWFFGNRTQGDGLKVTSINLYGGVQFYANEDVFYGCEALTSVNTSINNIPTFVNKDIIDSFFFKCTNLSISFTLSYWVGPFTGTAIDFNGGTEVGLIPSGSSNGYFDFDFAPTSLLRAFKNQASFNNQSLSNWDVSGSNDFSSAFEGCLRFNRPLPWTFQTGSPILATEMFKNAVDFNQDITAWDTSAFTKMDGMFARTLSIVGPVTPSSFNQPIALWDTNSVEDATSMFFNAEVFNRDLTNWFSTGSLGSTSGGIGSIFAGASNFNGQVLNWDTSNVTLFTFVFNRASAFNQDLSRWDTSSGVAFISTFNDATSFNQDLSSWDVSMGLFFDEMFKGATSFLGTGIDSWNTASASSFSSMFNGASAFNQNLYSWDISNLTNASDMLTGTAISNDNWDSLLIGWGYAQQANLNNNVTLSDVPAQHGPGFVNAIFDKLTDSVANGGYGWTILDQGQSALPPPPLEFTIDTTATETGSSANDQYRLPLMSTGTYNFYVDWGDGTIGDQITSWNQAEATHTYATAGTYIVQILATARVGQTPSVDHISWASQNGTTLTAANDRLKVQGIAKWGSAQVYLNEYVFTRCPNLDITTTALPNFGSKVLRTSAFENCDSLSGNLSGWGTVSSPITGFGSLFYKDAASSNPNFNFVFQANVGPLTQVFNNSTDFNNPLDNWDVSNASGFTQTFSSATSFNQDISGWDTGNSGAFNGMFINASSFNQNISSWNVANATTFSQMFQGATLFNQPVGAWTTTSLTNLLSTFKNAAAFDQDLANWDVSGVTTAVDMLTGSNISAANWDALLIGWAAQGTGAGSLQANVTLSNINQLHGSVDSAATAAYNKLTASPYNWTIVDLGGVPVGNLLLDTSYGSGAEAAYSVRKLRTAYTGPAIKVQDTVGGATQDIYFDANNNLDEAAIISYGGSNDVFVETWYDQSVNGNDAEQPSSTLRPKIYDGTTGALVKENGRLALDFDGVSENFTSTITNVSQSFDIYTVHNFNTTPTATQRLYDSDNGGRITRGSNGTSNNFAFAGTVLSWSPQQTGQVQETTVYNGVSSLVRVSGTQTASGDAGTSATGTDLVIGADRTASTQFIDGQIQEFIIFDNSKNATDRTSIEENIGDYFTQNTPLLDTYSGAAAAYSLRLLDSTYTGFAIKVQDNVGGATQDIGFNVFGELDTVSLLQYAGSNDVFVETWYDQSGSGNNATQPSSTLRPKIVSGGVVILENGKPSVTIGISAVMPFTSAITTAQTMLWVGRMAFAQYNRVVGNSIEVTEVSKGYINALSGTEKFNPTSISINGTNDTSSPYGSNLVGLYHSAYALGSGVGTSGLQSIGWNGQASRSWRGNFQELIIYSDGLTSERAGIENNLNTFYDIYTEPVAPLLLNNYPGAAAAYSLRRINSSYQGSAVLVQTANNTKGPVYIGFDSNNDLDTVSLAAYGGSEEVVVAGWLDQSGNGNDAIQNSAGSRPVIYRDSTATTPGVVTENGKPAVEFDGSNDVLKTSSVVISGTVGRSMFVIAKADTVGTDSIFSLTDNGSGTGSLWQFTPEVAIRVTGSQVFANNPIDSQTLGSVHLASSSNIADIEYFENGTQATATSLGTTDPINTSSLGVSEIGGSDDKIQWFYDGNIQEIIMYGSDQSANRTDIEENIGGYYDIPLPGLLDENPGAAAAYSLRRLSSTYTGSAIQVQRADNVGGTTDIGFDGYGNLDTVALTTAAAGNDMVVATWYDQSGNSNDATQGSSLLRPKIYDGTTGVVTEGSAGNEKPAVQFDGTDDALLTGVDFLIKGTFSVATATGTGCVFGSANFGSEFLRASNSTQYQLRNGVRMNINTDTTLQSLVYAANDTTSELAVNGSTSVTNTDLGTDVFDSVNLGSGATNFLDGNLQEVIIYETNKSDNRTGIETNIGGYYDIPLTGLLDENPGAAAAYSLRRLSSTYTGSAIQVQRADNVGGTTDIGFDSYGELDTTALTTAAQGNDMVVATWYDQSGNSNDATQGSSLLRPKIYDGTTGVIVDDNGKPAAYFDGPNEYLLMASDTAPLAGFMMMNPTSAAGGSAYVGGLTSSDLFGPESATGLRYRRSGTNYITSDLSPRGNHIFSFVGTGSSVSIFQDGTGSTDNPFSAGALSGINQIFRRQTLYTVQGYAQEIVLYDSAQSSNRTDIESNIGGYYDIPLAGLLDENPGAAAAYSLRRLSSTYTGSAIQVQRADNVGGTTDIGFDSYGELDTTALTTAAQGNDMVVATWYDQSGNSNDLTQNTTGQRPKIYDATNGVETENGKPILRKVTANASMRSAYDISTGGDRTVIMNHTRPINFIGLNATTWIGNGSNDNFFSSQENQPNYPILTNVTINSAHKNGSSWSYPTTRQDLWTDINGQNLYFIDADFSFGTTGFCFGFNDGQYDFAMMDTQEIIIYDSAQSANRTDIESNINTFYDIY